MKQLELWSLWNLGDGVVSWVEMHFCKQICIYVVKSWQRACFHWRSHNIPTQILSFNSGLWRSGHPIKRQPYRHIRRRRYRHILLRRRLFIGRSQRRHVRQRELVKRRPPAIVRAQLRRSGIAGIRKSDETERGRVCERWIGDVWLWRRLHVGRGNRVVLCGWRVEWWGPSML